MPWRALPRIAFGICTYPFQPSSTADLPLEIGDELYIIEQGGVNGDWYRGYLVAPPSLLAGLTSVKGQTLEARVFSGIFPKCCVEIRELLGEARPQGHQEQASRGYDGALENGLRTPTESLSPTPTGARADSRATVPSRVSSLSMRHGKRIASRSSHRSEQSHVMLPISPVSAGSQDPNAPKPSAPVPMLKIGDETPMFAQEPLVDEIASCLREWHSTKLHELLLARRYGCLDKVSAMVQRLDSARRQLLHKVLTKKELAELRERTVWDLVNGNKLLSGEVIVRSPSQRGRILTADDSAVEITKLQSVMSLLDERPSVPVDENTLYHLLVDIKDFAGTVNQPTTVAFHLCSKTPGQPLQPVSEVYAVDLSGRDGSTAVLAMGRLKTLFVDLSAMDVGESPGANSQMFLVFKVLTNEPTRTRLTAPIRPSALPRESTSSDSGSGLGQSPIGTVKGRSSRMVLGGNRRKRSDEPRPSTSETQNSTERKASSSGHKTPNSKEKAVKRVAGVGVIPVDSLLRKKDGQHVEVDIWTPAFVMEERDDSEEGWDAILPELSTSPSGRYKKLPSPNRLDIHVHGFSHPDPQQLIEKTPTLLSGVVPTRKIGFSGAPTKPRSDIYLTISSASLPRNAFLSHPKTGAVPLTSNTPMANLQLTLEVRRSSGERIDNCIYPSCNTVGQTAWRTQAVERGESWDITIRLEIAPEDVPGSHIVMSVADHPEFPFALCWMPLWTQGAFVHDGDHTLVLYKYDEYTSSVISGKGAYLGLPWSARKNDEMVTGPSAVINLRTYLCSTEYSQDPNLLGLLKWREQAGPMLTELLRRFVFVPEIEIVKLLNDVFDALFEILVEYSGSDEHEDLVFNALVTVLGITHDRRFKLGPLVDQYAATSFKYPSAASSLIHSCSRLFQNAADPNAARMLRATFKVNAHLLKFIGNARNQQEQRENGIGITGRQPAFTKAIRGLFQSLESLMRNPQPTLVGTKTLLVQNFHSWLPELSAMLSPKDTLEVATSFVESCATAQGKLVLYKLVMILNYTNADVFKLPETRQALQSNTIRWLSPHWGAVNNVTDQYREQVRLCCSIVAAQLPYLGQEASEYIPKLIESYRAIQAIPREPKQILALLFPSSYPFPTKPTSTSATFQEELVEIAAVLAELANLPGALQLYMDRVDSTVFLLNALHVYISILDHEPYPETWLSVHIYHHKATMRSLEKLSNILIDSFLPSPDEADQFNTELWRAFFDALLRLVGSPALALETFPEQKRRAVWKIAGDVREQGAELLHRTWEAIGWETGPDEKQLYGLERMGGFQVQYVPGLVAPIVELCLSVHEGLRSVAIDILQTMIASEWTLSQDLSLIQAEMVDCLDQLFKSRRPSESMLQKLFVVELLDLFEPLSRSPDDSLYHAVKDLIETIDELLDLLAAVHSHEGTGEAAHIMDTLHLMEFLKDMQKEDMYIRYVHQLAQVQANARNFTEAGLALRLHAELYEWNPAVTEDSLKEPHYPCQTAFERKEQLYFEMIKFFEQGMSWDNALEAYMELATQYEHNIFDFAKLARTQRAMATVYESISKGERQTPRYFRVIYKGLGFPVGLRDKEFIFEGSATDRLAAFTDRMQQQYPAAQILSPGSEMDLEGQYLQIYPVSAQKDLMHPIYQRWKVPQPIREHYLLSRPNNFTITNRRNDRDGFKEATVEKTVYTTAEPFPCILRRREIISKTTVVLTPLQTAIERTTRKTTELTALEKRAMEGDDSALGPLAEAIMLSVDRNSETSVAQYRDFIPSPKPRDSAEVEDEEMVEPEEIMLDPLQNALRVALIDHALAIKRCLGLYTRPAQQATKVDLTKRFESTFAPELEVLSPAPASQLNSPTASYHPTITPPRVVSPMPPRPPSDPQTTAGAPDPRPTRSEKARLSLTFLKRGNLSEQRNSNSFAKTNGHLDHVNEETVSNANSAPSASSRQRSKSRNRLSFLQGGTSANTTPKLEKEEFAGLQRENSVPASDRPGTGAKSEVKSEKSGSSGFGDRVGSVRKRLSILGIGKKSSKTSVRGVGRVEEED